MIPRRRNIYKVERNVMEGNTEKNKDGQSEGKVDGREAKEGRKRVKQIEQRLKVDKVEERKGKGEREGDGVDHVEGRLKADKVEERRGKKEREEDEVDHVEGRLKVDKVEERKGKKIGWIKWRKREGRWIKFERNSGKGGNVR